MLGRLLKYELRFGARTFSGLIAALLLVGVVAPLLGFVAETLMGTIALGLVAVTCLVLVLQAYYKSLFSAQGYLSRTLPVKTSALVGSKLIATLLWFNLGCASVAVYYALLFRDFDWLFRNLGPHFWNIVGIMLNLNCFALAVVLTGYFAMALGSMSVKGRRLGIAGHLAGAAAPVGALVLLYAKVLPAVNNKRFLFVTGDQGIFFSTGTVVWNDNGGTVTAVGDPYLASGGVPLITLEWGLLLACLAVAAACYFGTAWILKRRSDLM